MNVEDRKLIIELNDGLRITVTGEKAEEIRSQINSDDDDCIFITVSGQQGLVSMTIHKKRIKRYDYLVTTSERVFLGEGEGNE